MYLVEVIAHKNFIKQKLSEVSRCLETNQTEELAAEFMDLLEQLQTKLININSANQQSTLNLGGMDIPISVAVIIRDTMKSKMDVLTNLIDNPDCKLSKLDLIRQRDNYFNEYILMSMGIQKNDLSVRVG